MADLTALTRRSLLKSGGALIVSFAFGAALPKEVFAQAGPPPGGRGGPGGPAVPMDLDSFIAIKADGSVTLFTSHVDVGTGLSTAYRQIAAEELGIPVERFTVIEGDTSVTPDHGGTGGSSGVPRGGADIRRAAATARKALLDLGAAALSRPASELTIADGVVGPPGAAAGQRVTLASLIGGKQFSLKVDPNAVLKSPATYTVVGKPILRTDVPAKATGRHVYVQDFTVPGMLHARVVRPPSPGARLLTIDQSSISGLPDVRVVRIENFLGVVAGDEWAATRAARELKATWSEGESLPGSADLDATMHTASSERDQPGVDRGDAPAALSSAAKQLSAIYYWPFQSHASLGPSCAVADVKDSGTTVWSSTQDAFGLRSLLSRTFSIPPDKLRVVYMDGSGSYGSNGAYDAAADAVILSRAVGGPVRLQWTRQDEHVWDPKGPAQLLELRGGLDAGGHIVAWESHASGPAGPQWTGGLLGPTAAGMTTEPGRGGGAPVTQNVDPPYTVPNLRVLAHQLKDTPIRLSNLRAPGKIANVFAVESFTDELAAPAAVDAVAFRRRALTDPRAIAVLDRAASMLDCLVWSSSHYCRVAGLSPG